MKWLRRARRPGTGRRCGPTLLLPPALFQAIRCLAQEQGTDPEELANVLLGEALERRRLAASAWGRWQTLSPREQEIARLAAGGLSGARIARQLWLAPETVRNHLSNALHKLDLERRAQLREVLEGIDREEE